MCIYYHKKSNLLKYNTGLFIPVLDCIHQQKDTCEKDERECSFSPLDIYSENQLEQIKMEDLVREYKENKDYSPCRNCIDFKGSVWLKYRGKTDPLDYKTAWKTAEKLQRRWDERNNFKLLTFPNETFTMRDLQNCLDNLENKDNFIPDVIIIDYADLFLADKDCRRMEFRHQQNKLWQRLRKLSQERHSLVITATQAAASSYDKPLLTMNDFSEARTKMDHVTAMYALNQTPREKQIGIIRIGPIVVREDDFDTLKNVNVLQRLQIGRPYLGSFY
jgi:hypothetical protein